MVALKTLVFTIVMPGMVGGVIPWLLAQGESGPNLPPPLSVWMLGLVPIALGVVLYLWCAGAFTFIGKGTPAPIDAPVVLVAQGPYRWVRNPMYIAVLAVILGQALVWRSWLLVGYALLFCVVVHTFVVAFEEPSLREQFGESYEAYLRRVPRWLPRPPRA
ncbi:MAG TPA: isoprenylcysteine carboxylmethyltransferase family protein [Ktedonobacterales bacterium]|nr:isoprenylcysteine carboxylmethyltransferase family protein [Ktedonobacterales bacterium]